MAPNRQSVASVVHSIATEDLVVTESKYPPLTSSSSPARTSPSSSRLPAEAEGSVSGVSDVSSPIHDEAVPENYWDEVSEERNDALVSRDNYWLFPNMADKLDSMINAAEAEERRKEEDREWKEEVTRREAVLADILREEQAREAVSLGNVETKLVQDAQRRRTEEDVRVGMARNADAEEENLEGYWDWDAETERPIEEPSSAFTADHIENRIKDEAARLSSASSNGPVMKARNDSYWLWDTLTPDQEKRRLIEGILEDEGARLVLSASRIEANLKKNTFACSSAAEVVRGAEEKESYWFFPSSEGEPI